MKIKDLYNGRIHEYGSNPHDSLVVSEDGRTLTYYNLQNGDGSDYGDYRFVPDMEAPEENERYWNIGGMSKPERKTGKWEYGEDVYGIDGYHCNKCGFFVPWDYTHKFINFIADYNYCPNCGAKMEDEECS